MNDRRTPGPVARGPVLVEGPREVAAAALGRVLDDAAWAAPTLSAALDISAMTERDKGLATELFYGALRFAGPLEKSLLRAAAKPGKGLDPRIRPHLLIAAYQLQHLSERIPAHAVVSSAVTSIKRIRPGLDGFANALLRHLGSPLHALLKPDAILFDIAEAWGVPYALAKALAKGQPSDTQHAIVASLCARPTTFACFFATVSDDNDLTPHAFVPRSFALPGGRVSALPGFADGDFLVMDPGSTLCALAATAAPGATVLDLCAAPGGKAMVLADAVGNTGRVIAVEQHARRSLRIGENAQRLGLSARITTVVGDAGDLDAALREHGAPNDGYDVVVLDAPCSGLGTTRRKPEVKLKNAEADVVECLPTQARLFDAAAARVKVDGVLVYSVCSPMPQEGEQQVEQFLTRHPEYVRESIAAVLPWLPADALDVQGQVHLLPHLHDADAFFISRLRRRA